MQETVTSESAKSRLYFWVLLAVIGGGLLGYLDPKHAVLLKPVGDGFISLIKMLIGPVVFCTIALAIGVLIANLLRPGQGFNVDPATLDAQAVSGYVKQASQHSFSDFLLHIIPQSFTDAFTGNGDLLQVLLVAVLFGYALQQMGSKGRAVHVFIEECSHIFFAMMAVIMKLAPLGAGAAMAFTLGKYGLAALKPLVALMGSFYLSCGLFVLGVLGVIAASIGFN